MANLVVHSDLNAVSVIDFAVNALEVEEIIVCGHYGCGGIEAALSPASNPSSFDLDRWLTSHGVSHKGKVCMRSPGARWLLWYTKPRAKMCWRWDAPRTGTNWIYFRKPQRRGKSAELARH